MKSTYRVTVRQEIADTGRLGKGVVLARNLTLEQARNFTTVKQREYTELAVLTIRSETADGPYEYVCVGGEDQPTVRLRANRSKGNKAYYEWLKKYGIDKVYGSRTPDERRAGLRERLLEHLHNLS